jgi:transposase-like protein
MSQYSPERKQAILNKMTESGLSIPKLAKEEGISEATLYNWRNQARANGTLMPDSDAGPKGFSAQDRLNAVIQTAAMNEAQIAEYCRKHGLYPEQIERWRQSCLAGCETSPSISLDEMERSRKKDKKQIQKLEKELKRKEKALAEAAALMVLRKNLETLLGEEDA